MTMILHSGDGNGLFDIQGKALHAIDVLNVATGTTVADTIQNTVDQLNLVAPIPLSYEQTASAVPNGLAAWQGAGASLGQTLATFCQNLLIAFVSQDSGIINPSLLTSLQYLVSQMDTNGDYVAANVVAGSLSANGGNVGDTVLVWTLLDGTGVSVQHAYAETIVLTVGPNPSASRPAITCVGAPAVSLLDPAWPAGSGISVTLTATNPAASLIANGTFEAETYPNIPDGWIVATGTPGTTVLLTAPAQQTVAIAGNPTGGNYILEYTDGNGRVWNTPIIAWNATQGTVQTALRTIPNLAAVTVSTTGTSPNFTHTITFSGTGGSIAALTYLSFLTGGTPAMTITSTVAGDPNDYRGQSLKLVGDSATLHSLYVPLTNVQSEQVYFCHVRLIRSGTATGASIKIDVVQGIGDTTLVDDAGNSNSLTINVAELSNSAHTSAWFAFRLAAAAVTPIYLRIAAVAAIPTGASLYLDEVAVSAATQLYNGGPFVGAFSGRTPAVSGDQWTLNITNNRAGLWQTWYDRAFSTADKGVLLPTLGSTLIADTDLYPA